MKTLKFAIPAAVTALLFIGVPALADRTDTDTAKGSEPFPAADKTSLTPYKVAQGQSGGRGGGQGGGPPSGAGNPGGGSGSGAGGPGQPAGVGSAGGAAGGVGRPGGVGLPGGPGNPVSSGAIGNNVGGPPDIARDRARNNGFDTAQEGEQRRAEAGRDRGLNEARERLNANLLLTPDEADQGLLTAIENLDRADGPGEGFGETAGNEGVDGLSEAEARLNENLERTPDEANDGLNSALGNLGNGDAGQGQGLEAQTEGVDGLTEANARLNENLARTPDEANRGLSTAITNLNRERGVAASGQGVDGLNQAAEQLGQNRDRTPDEANRGLDEATGRLNEARDRIPEDEEGL